MLQTGDKAPDFSLQDENSATRKLSDFRGRDVVLFFYPKANTPG
jgi:thioredoxin-dependent peroxiredoxin